MNILKRQFFLTLILVVLFSLSIAGCSKVTQENYAKIKMGMAYEEVTKILGNPTNCKKTLGIERCVWQADDKEINIKFAGGKAILFSKKNL